MKIHKAIEVASLAHKNQVRKGTQIPYIVHLFETAVILSKNGASDDVICAGILHDTLEDTAITKNDLIDEFGEKITKLVLSNSETKTLTWEERKQETIDFLTNKATRDELFVACADKLSNARSLLYDYNKLGDKLWERFKRPYNKQKWYYTNLVKAFSKISDSTMQQEFSKIVQKVFLK